MMPYNATQYNCIQRHLAFSIALFKFYILL